VRELFGDKLERAKLLEEVGRAAVVGEGPQGRAEAGEPTCRPVQIGDVALQPGAAQYRFATGFQGPGGFAFERAFGFGVLHLIQDDTGKQPFDARAQRGHPPTLDGGLFAGRLGEGSGGPGGVAALATVARAAAVAAATAVEVRAGGPALGTSADDLAAGDAATGDRAFGAVVVVVRAEEVAVAVIGVVLPGVVTAVLQPQGFVGSHPELCAGGFLVFVLVEPGDFSVVEGARVDVEAPFGEVFDDAGDDRGRGDDEDAGIPAQLSPKGDGVSFAPTLLVQERVVAFDGHRQDVVFLGRIGAQVAIAGGVVGDDPAELHRPGAALTRGDVRDGPGFREPEGFQHRADTLGVVFADGGHCAGGGVGETEDQIPAIHVGAQGVGVLALAEVFFFDLRGLALPAHL